MSSLFLEIGQCGCQIGVPLNSKLASCYYCTRTRPPHSLHSIMVDTQPKVIKQIISKHPKWLDPSNLKYFQYGRGNNWSYGYLHHLPSEPLHSGKGWEGKQFSHLQPATIQKYLQENREIADYVIERIRRELENMDCAMAINVLGSLGGGTGSGLGTKIVECINEEFNISTFCHLVLPNKSGQSPLQVYNCLLSLSSLQQHSSAIFTYQNDKMMSLFQKTEQKESTLDDINDHLAENISRMIKINQLPKYDRFYSQIVSECVISPQLKFLNLFGGQESQGKWDNALSKMIEEIRNYQSDEYGEDFVSKKGKRHHLLQGQLLLMGSVQSNFENKYGKKMKHLLSPLFEDSLNIENIAIPKGKEEKVEAVLFSNHSNITNYLGYLVSSGSKKYQSGAYLWHYQYADIEQAIDSVERIIQQYHYVVHS